jgi:hypothetical protein
MPPREMRLLLRLLGHGWQRLASNRDSTEADSALSSHSRNRPERQCCSRRRGHVAFPEFIAHSGPAAAELYRSIKEMLF